jgi:uncharacterized phage protein gp47/JayE
VPDILDATGLQVKSLDEIVTDLEDGFKAIYGTDINLDQNSPDGQAIRIFAQSARDMRELIQQINAGFSPNGAIGRVLDERVAFNNIARIGGTYTIQPIDITVNATVNLQGLDADFNDINGTGYTVQDDAGNEFILIDSTALTVGTTAKNFRAKNIGLVETIVGTITTPKTIVLGVTAINNSSAAAEVGQEQETDALLRSRRQRSVAIASDGYLNGIEAALLSVDGVTESKVYENFTDATDADGIPEHAIWAIVEGGANSDIGDIIYAKKSAGCDMRGDVVVNIITASGAVFAAKFDRPAVDNLHIRFDIQTTMAGAIFDQDLIKASIAASLVYGIGDFAETSLVTAEALTAIDSNGGGGVPVNVEISDDGIAWVDYLDVATLKSQWGVDATRITITEL